MQKRLSEATQEEVLFQATLQKALSSAPLTLQELQTLQELDFGSLVIEHNMSYTQAKHVLLWRRNEKQRINALSLQQPIEGWLPRGSRQGSRSPEMQESKSRVLVRNLIKEELSRIGKKSGR